MALERTPLPADAQFWPRAAQAVAQFAQRTGSPPGRLNAVTWIVPSGHHAVLARSALAQALGGGAFMPPRIVPLESWARHPLRTGVSGRVELFNALRDNAWIRESFGAHPAALWSLAGAVAELSDELTWLAAADPAALEGRLLASLNRHYFWRAERVLQPQAQLVLRLWHARRSADDGPARALAELGARASASAGPIVYTTADALDDARPVAPSRWEAGYVERWAQHAEVLLISADLGAAVAARPLLAAAWPELSAGAVPASAPIRARGVAAREALQAQDGGADGADGARPLTLLCAATLEDSAIGIAQQVLAWRHAGVESIALVALDRLIARRVRALLERALVRVRDESGWRLSTTSAAAAVMRWYDLVADDLYWRDVLDWLKSTFTLRGRERKRQEIAVLERAIRAGGALQGAGAIRGALAEYRRRRVDANPPAAEPAQGGGQPDRARADDLDGADAIVALLEAQAAATRAARATLGGHARALQAACDRLGMRAALADDDAGRAVLLEIDALAAELAHARGSATLAEFRALLAARLEELPFRDPGIDSPVVMLPLAATALRRFDAALLIGVDAVHLPAVRAGQLFMPNAVRAELGLSTLDDQLRAQAAQLAGVLAGTPRVAAAWRTQVRDEPNPLSPLLLRLQFVVRQASGDDLQQAVVPDTRVIRPVATLRPAPAAAALLPARLSATRVQSLVNCPYQFYAHDLLRLKRLDDVIEMPEKREFGTVLHDVLLRFHRHWKDADFAALDARQLADDLARHAREVFAPEVRRTPGMLAFQLRFEAMIDGYVEWLQKHAEAGWRWLAGEERVARPLTLAGGRTIELEGRVDRIDRAGAGDSERLHVIDYKVRRHDQLRRGLSTEGEDIQLPFYGLLLGSRVQSAAYLAFDRARENDSGVKPVALPREQPFDAVVARFAERLATDLQRIVDGASLPALGVEPTCNWCQMRGLCRRDYWERGDEEPA
jgi:ATP-dependent helicase/nuclease subunit B